MQLGREFPYSRGAIYEAVKGRFFNHFTCARGLDRSLRVTLRDSPTVLGSGMRTLSA